MSRSYKKTPWSGDQKSKFAKRKANARVRKFLKNINNELQYNSYKKIYESWDICDYGCIISWEQYWKRCLELYEIYPDIYKHPPIYKEEYRKWYKWHKMK